MKENGRNGESRKRRNGELLREVARRPYSFFLDAELVERARMEVGENDVVRSIEAALAAAIDYKVWLHEVERGDRDVLA